jgi:hypothetical protein
MENCLQCYKKNTQRRFLKRQPNTAASTENGKTHPSLEEGSKKHIPALRRVSKYPSCEAGSRKYPSNAADSRKYISTVLRRGGVKKKYIGTPRRIPEKIHRHCVEFLEHISASCLSMYPNLFKFVTPFS